MLLDANKVQIAFCATPCLKVRGWKDCVRRSDLRRRRGDLRYLLQPLGVILHGVLQTLQLPVLPRRLVLVGRPRRRWARLGRRVPLVGAGDLEVIRGTTVLHLGEDEGEAAGAVLNVMLLALRGRSDGQQAGQVGEGQGQRAAHGGGERVTAEEMLHNLEEQTSGDE